MTPDTNTEILTNHIDSFNDSALERLDTIIELLSDIVRYTKETEENSRTLIMWMHKFEGTNYTGK